MAVETPAQEIERLLQPRSAVLFAPFHPSLRPISTSRQDQANESLADSIDRWLTPISVIQVTRSEATLDTGLVEEQPIPPLQDARVVTGESA